MDWPGALQEFLLSTLLWHMGHVSPEQNFCIPTETAPAEHFCTEICILQAAGKALELFREERPFLNTEGKLEGVTVGQALISSSPLLCLDQKSTAESQGVIIVAIIVAILVVAVLGAVIYFLHKKGKIPCGRAGKQDM